MIRLDVGAATVVVLCSHCPLWRVVRMDRPSGWTAGAAHDASVHPANRQASDVVSKLRQRGKL